MSAPSCWSFLFWVLLLFTLVKASSVLSAAAPGTDSGTDSGFLSTSITKLDQKGTETRGNSENGEKWRSERPRRHEGDPRAPERTRRATAPLPVQNNINNDVFTKIRNISICCRGWLRSCAHFWKCGLSASTFILLVSFPPRHLSGQPRQEQQDPGLLWQLGEALPVATGTATDS